MDEEFNYDDSGSSNGNGGTGLLDWAKWGGSTATGLLGALKQSRQTAAPTPAPTNWGLIAGIGAAVLVVLVLVVSLRK